MQQDLLKTHVDECSLGLHDCSPQQVCINTVGSFICECNQANLTSINNKCVVDNGGINMYCYLMDSVQICECEKGFEIKSSSNSLQICEDIDECKSNPCPANSICKNLNGSFTCECLAGFIGSRATDHFECLDLDECSSSCLNTCDAEYGLCINQPGSYECQCKQGLYGNGRQNGCFDINECLSNQTKCHSNSKCLNTIGSYECRCEDGFYNTGMDCEEIN
ncbi:Fibrillin [Brachionus plicatilis]|uniref:Fibrillin n=1 Tax=Brachionus plicatilis TaxID=10195 RepID=A0A3M7RWW2_BRAPC|nr:Fibrillin [Brachionus plicatilis]